MATIDLGKTGLTFAPNGWDATTTFEKLTVLMYQGNGYASLVDNKGVTPGTDSTKWMKITESGESLYQMMVRTGQFTGTEAEFLAEYTAKLTAATNAANAATTAAASATSAASAATTGESARAAAETARASAESARASAETARASAETTRTGNESARVQAEANRVTAENTRSSNETTRVSNETGRVSAENTRRANETSRVSAESGRATAEATRVNNESGRIHNEQTRQSNETLRVSAETARASAETSRTATFNTDHTTAQADHTTAGTDHTTAQSDHTTAGTDHTASQTATAAATAAAAAASSLETRIKSGDVIAALAENLHPWEQRSQQSVEDEWSESVRTSAGSLSIDSSKAASLLSLQANGEFKASAFGASGENLLNPSAMVGSAYVFLVPKMVRGSYGTADEANGILFVDSDGNNLNPTVRFSESYPTSASAGSAVTPYQFTGHSEYFYPSSGIGYFIVSGLTVSASNVCARIAWSKDYSKYSAFTAHASISLSSVIASLVASHSSVTDRMLSVGSLRDGIDFTASTATWTRRCSAVTPTWTNTAQEGGTYLHTATIPGTYGAMKSGGSAELIGQNTALTVQDTTVSFTDSNATCSYTVKYELATEVTGTASMSNSYSVSDLGIEYLSDVSGSFIVTTSYSQGMPDSVYALLARTDKVEAMRDEVDETFDEATDDDRESLPLLCGQPMKLFGAGTPQEAVVPINWKQFSEGGYNWNGLPSALGQEYINTSVTSGGHYTAVPDGYALKWSNF